MKNKIKRSIKKFNSINFCFGEVLLIMFLTIVIGVAIGTIQTKKFYGIVVQNSYSEELKEFISNYNYIINNYYGSLDEQELLDIALKKILEEIDDPYAVYMDENESSNFDIYLNGSYQGIGVEVAQLNSTGQLIITSVFSDSPADKAGIKTGDILLKIDNETLEGVSSTEFSKKIKNLSNSFLLTVLRDTQELDVEIKLETVVLKSVEAELLEDNIGYLAISIFADNTYQQVKEAMDLLQEQGMTSLIIDLRNNTGGYLTSVDNILGLYLDSSHVIYQIQDKSNTTKFYSKGKITVDYGIVLLTNANTASAAEIMTAALKEEIGALSVGETTYGKGSAQKIHTNSNGSKYKFTTQKWLTPLGNSIDNIGISVDYEVKLDNEYYNNPVKSNDNQLKKAIELLK